MSKNLGIYSINAFLILDNEGKRLLAKYYQPPHSQSDEQDASSTQFGTLKSQKSFEAALFKKTFKQNADVILFESHIVVYKEIADFIVLIVGGLDENEVGLFSVLEAFKDALDKIFSFQLDKKSIQENYDKVSIALDETVDDGIILETEPSIIAARTSNAPTNEPTLSNIELSEKGLLSAWSFAKSKLAERLQ